MARGKGKDSGEVFVKPRKGPSVYETPEPGPEPLYRGTNFYIEEKKKYSEEDLRKLAKVSQRERERYRAIEKTKRIAKDALFVICYIVYVTLFIFVVDPVEHLSFLEFVIYFLFISLWFATFIFLVNRFG
jgi:hypothetical protein